MFVLPNMFAETSKHVSYRLRCVQMNLKSMVNQFTQHTLEHFSNNGNSIVFNFTGNNTNDSWNVLTLRGY